MNAGTAFAIGATHKVCQDYAVAGNGEARQNVFVGPYVLLSDGCSGSPDTDIGARLLVKAGEQVLTHFSCTTTDSSLLHEEAARRALLWAILTGLHIQSVDATLVTAHVNGEELIIGCSGDGVIALESKSGAVDVYSISYDSGYPVYPAYLHQPDRLMVLDTTDKQIKHFHSASTGEVLKISGVTISDSITEAFNLRKQDYKLVAVISDGIHSFFRTAQNETSKRLESIAMTQVVSELISYKSISGAFVERRFRRFLKDSLSRGWLHTDDLAIGVIYLGD